MKALKLLAWSYLIKTILFGIAWLLVPDLPHRAAGLARRAWSAVDRRAPEVHAPAAVPPVAVSVSK